MTLRCRVAGLTYFPHTGPHSEAREHRDRRDSRQMRREKGAGITEASELGASNVRCVAECLRDCVC